MSQSVASSPRLSIVFLNFNRIGETRTTTDHLLRLTADREDIEVIAVDNGSGDGTTEYLAARDGLTAVLLDDNRGIAGYNAGFEKARGEYLLILDDDSCPADVLCIDHAMALLDTHRDVGIVACRIETPGGALQWSWHLPGTPDRAGPSMAFVGCGFFVRRKLFRHIGWYPGEFFLYQNEIDVAVRTRLEGFRILYEPRCRVVHRGDPGQRPGWRRVFYSTRNTLWLIRRYFPFPERGYLLTSRLLIGLVRSLWFRQPAAYLRAVREGLGRPVPRVPLPPWLLRELGPFRRQNSILHHIGRRA